MEDLQRALVAAKTLYRSALTNLEQISNEIHASRRADDVDEPLPERTPGVGAEADVIDAVEDLSINLGAFSTGFPLSNLPYFVCFIVLSCDLEWKL